MRRIARIVFPTVVLLAFAAFVWPTPWAYFAPASGSRPSAWQLRRNRFTGTVEWLGPEGWARCEPPKRQPELPTASPPWADRADEFLEALRENKERIRRGEPSQLDEIHRRFGRPDGTDENR